jgi:hypothetical protein
MVQDPELDSTYVNENLLDQTALPALNQQRGGAVKRVSEGGTFLHFRGRCQPHQRRNYGNRMRHYLATQVFTKVHTQL